MSESPARRSPVRDRERLPAGTDRRYRPELQGLRALAVVLVVVYHVWLGRVSGGVDVFFLISGFLITGQLYRAGSRGGIAYGAMWGRMVKRLFPAALTVLAAVIVASVVLLPEARWFQTIKEVAASALYLENWRLAADSADYFAQHDSASVVQHFWSLSIQGQFYLVWPLLVGLVAVVAKRALRPTLLIVLLAVFAVSLVFSIQLTGTDQPLAYFHSLTRVWEFAAGGLLALLADRVRLPLLVRIAAGWAGVAGLISCGLLLRVDTEFPGFVALWPIVSAALIIVAGSTGNPFAADRPLGSRPLEFVGNLSFSLYLWHWPVLVFYLVARERTEVGLLGGAVVIGISVLLSVATYQLVEKPVRDSAIGASEPRRALAFGALLLVPVLLATGGWQLASEQKAGSLTIDAADHDHPGAKARTPGFTYRGTAGAAPAPSYLALPDDWSPIEPRCGESPASQEELDDCTTTAPGEAPARRVVLVGDSHARQYTAALLPIAERRNWQVTVMFRSACPFSTDSDIDPDDEGCREWNTTAAELISSMKPDAVLTMASRDVRAGPTEQTPSGFAAQWRRLAGEGIPVLAIRDNPRFDVSPAACAEQRGPDDPSCATPRDLLLPPRGPYADIPDLPPSVSFLDFSDYVCEPDTCPPVIGNVLVYRDENHLSAAYTSTMTPMVEEAVESALRGPENETEPPA
ncbi:acyltransferase family protein [Amycolatopsis sp. CA-230715]|uniref:acyltransferase family protein n=1 Tax=Amycolatopsis sp. CA-230715 TaxID=2745196 RepID=UPI001C0341CB|nr:acyltransferase family protein [Amycolatopsis sp. CA-230715]QWF84447.1 hypothetical protein HUW46_07897 [Amycolatopsis sp. CA-230715]